MKRTTFSTLFLISSFICCNTFGTVSASIASNEIDSSNDDVNLNITLLPTENIESLRRKGKEDEDLSKYLPCIKCTRAGKKGNDCMKIDNPIFVSNCRKAIGQCYTAIIDGDVYRGCVGDELFPDRKSTENPSVQIKLCNDNRMCNQDTILDTCLGCTGKACKAPTLDMERPCSLEPRGQGCYLKERRGRPYERGCVQDLTRDEQKECQKHGSIDCQSCPDRNCNQKINFDQKCYYCNGTKEKSCFEAENQDISITCIGYSSTCLVGVDENGYAHRQCSSSDEDDDSRFPNGFELCYGNLCNNQLFPKEWTKCFRCANGKSCDHPSANILPEFCRIYGDSCYIQGIEDGEFVRGCMSDEEVAPSCEGDAINKNECYICNKTECNYLQSFQLKKLRAQNVTSKSSVNVFTLIMGSIVTLFYSLVSRML